MPSTEVDLASLLRRQIAAAGPISFARFMELALYHPTHGYYQQSSQQIGCQGDFYTSVSVGPLLGQLLGFQFAQWLDSLPSEGPSAPLRLVEGGAHDGRLALDILSWFQVRRPDLLARLEYWILEPFAARRESQARLLAPFRPSVRWLTAWDEVPSRSVRGILFANELLDALPVFRVGWDASRHQWFEWKVGTSDVEFAWTRCDPPSPEVERELKRALLGNLPGPIASVLPDGFTVELCPAARAWWSSAAERLGSGRLLTLDYGLEWPEILAPHRAQGTLRGYQAHRQVTDPLAHPGKQDLTAHVNFSEIVQAGEFAGLKTERLGPQSTFLAEILRLLSADVTRFGAWSQRETRQFQTLAHPDHLGRKFRVLIQNRLTEKPGAPAA